MIICNQISRLFAPLARGKTKIMKKSQLRLREFFLCAYADFFLRLGRKRRKEIRRVCAFLTYQRFQQAAKWSGAISARGGIASAHFSVALGQRVRKGQPEGILSGEGTSPSSTILL